MLQPAPIRDLLDSGVVHHMRWSGSAGAGSVRQGDTDSAAWSLDALRGRVVEFVGEGAASLTTVAIDLVVAAQGVAEPVVWLTHPGVAFYPPDAVASGVELDALTVVRLPQVSMLLRAVDQLLRSGAFGLVVVDFPEATEVPLSAQARLVGLTKRHDAALVCLSRGDKSALGSFASLRADCKRKRLDDGVFEWSVDVVKDKRCGQHWTHRGVCNGTVGLR